MAQDGANIFVVGGKADDPFFAVIKKGVDDAALAVEAYGGSVSFLQLQTYDSHRPRRGEPRAHGHQPGRRRHRGAELGARGRGPGDQGRASTRAFR